MKHRYEALLVLNTQGREDTLKEVIDRLESEFQTRRRPDRTSAENGQAPVFPTWPARSTPDITLTLSSTLSRSRLQNCAQNSSSTRRFIAKVTSESSKRRKSLRKRWRKRSDLVISREWPVLIKSFCLEISRAIRKCAIPPKAVRCAISASRSTAFTQLRAAKDAKKLLSSMLCCGRALAEIAGEYLRKGRPVFIEGRLQMDSWDDKQTGQKRTKLRVVGESMQLLGSRPGRRTARPPTKIE